MSDTHALKHESYISADVAAVKQALSSAEGLRSWNTPTVEGDGKLGTEWVLQYPDRPTFAWRIDLDDPAEILWTCTKGPGDAAGTTVRFTFSATADGRTKLGVTHGGWPHDAGDFTKCNTLWGALIHRLREYLETGVSDPAFS